MLTEAYDGKFVENNKRYGTLEDAQNAVRDMCFNRRNKLADNNSSSTFKMSVYVASVYVNRNPVYRVYIEDKPEIPFE